MAWTYNPNDYQENDFSPIPVGDHRVRISEVIFKTFNSGNQGYEITLEVSGHSGKLWHRLVLMHDNPKKTNQNIGSFFDSFGITDMNMDHFPGWVGKVGAVRVKHEEYNGNTSAKVAFCLARSKQDKLPAANFSGAVPTTNAGFTPMPDIPVAELPFE